MTTRAWTSMMVAGVLAGVGSGALAAPASMKAAVARDGVVKVETVPVPQPGEGQVRVRVHAASVNPVDWKLVARAAPGSSQTPGRDFSGVIDAVGPSAGEWKVGDPVIGVGAGSYAEYVIASTKAIASKPKNMSFGEASGLGIVAETAWRAIVTVADVQKGQKVLIHGGAGGVGSSAVQIAKARGAYVIATASARNHEFLKSLGVDETIDYRSVKFEDKVKNVDVVLNTVDAETGSRSVGVVKQGGMLVSIVGPTSAEACAAAKIRCAITGTVTGEMLPKVVELADAGKLQIPVEKTKTLADAAEAWKQSKDGHVRGKIILQIVPAAT